MFCCSPITRLFAIVIPQPSRGIVRTAKAYRTRCLRGANAQFANDPRSYAVGMASPTSYSLEPHGHFVQFYKADEPLLNRNVGRFLWDGLLRGDALLVIATPERRESVSSHLDRLGA